MISICLFFTTACISSFKVVSCPFFTFFNLESFPPEADQPWAGNFLFTPINHCSFGKTSTTSSYLSDVPTFCMISSSLINNPDSRNSSTIFSLASSVFNPENFPPSAVIFPSSPITFIKGKSFFIDIS